MPNLVESLGARYVNDYFSSALFRVGDDVHMFRGIIDGNRALVSTLRRTNAEPYWDEARVPADAIKDFTTFAVPRLGYRKVKWNQDELLITLEHQRSTRRGFRLELLNIQAPPISNLLFQSAQAVFGSFDTPKQAEIIFFPEYDTVKSGINKLLAAETTSVVLSPDTAIVLDVEQPGPTPFAVMFRGTRIGTVDQDGRIRINNKAVSRESFRRQAGLHPNE